MLLVIIGIIGLFGMSWLFPLVARLMPAPKGRMGSDAIAPDTRLRVRILIPVHNDSFGLEQTLRSIRRAIQTAAGSSPRVQYSVLVAADGCSDDSASVARRFGVEVYEFAKRQGKWEVLRQCLLPSNDTVDAAGIGLQACEWIVLADAGVLWPAQLLQTLRPFLFQSAIAAVAPAYENNHAGAGERLHWRLEAHLKTLENHAGGPVSVHGATVAYRRGALLRALRRLYRCAGDAGCGWYNDDVVIPLMLRAAVPEKQLVYLPQVTVGECVRPWAARSETGRRCRMARGNVQWIKLLLPEVARRNPRAAVLALRRVCRLLWAYWCLAAVTGAMLLAPAGLVLFLAAALLACLGAAMLRHRTRRLLEAAQASLASPIYWLSVSQEDVPWS